MSRASWGQPRARRTTALLLVATAPWLVGCGSGTAQDAAPTPVVIPGSTVTIGTEPGEVATPEPTPTVAGTSETAAPAPVPTGEELVARVGGAMGGFSTVRVELGDATAAPRLTVALDYTVGDLAAEVAPADGVPALAVRRVDGTAYVDAGAGFVVVPADQVDLDTTGLLPALAAFDLLADLRATLLGSPTVEALGEADVDGVAVEQFELTVDAADLVRPSLVVPDEGSGPVTVVVSVETSGLPVRLDYALPDGTTTRVGLRGYGDPVDVAVPSPG